MEWGQKWFHVRLGFPLNKAFVLMDLIQKAPILSKLQITIPETRSRASSRGEKKSCTPDHLWQTGKGLTTFIYM